MTNLFRKMNFTMHGAWVFAVWLYILAVIALAPPGAAVGHAAEFQVVDDLTVPNGNVGIGTTGPNQKLHVQGQCVTGDTMLSIVPGHAISGLIAHRSWLMEKMSKQQ